MKEVNKLSNAIGNIGAKFILEAFKYHSRLVLLRSVQWAGAAVISLCLIIGMAVFTKKNSDISITVYAYETNMELTNGKTILMPGQINDDGQMQGHPLQFYVSGNKIASIRFSCKKERISFVDWTERRGDYGLSKNFTVTYGENEGDYYYLVMDWVPETIIRKLTDNEDIRISDLTQEEKEDVIVMEITYQAFESYLSGKGMVHSFSRKGNPYDKGHRLYLGTNSYIEAQYSGRPLQHSGNVQSKVQDLIVPLLLMPLLRCHGLIPTL